MKDLRVPPKLRGVFKKPFGELYAGKGLIPAKKIKSVLKDEKLVIVGDVTLMNMLAVGVRPDLAIVDLKSMREEDKSTELGGTIVKAVNPPGMISKDLWDKIHEAMEKSGTTILVDGEEDLAVLPCIIEADWDTVILYGQPDEGIVYVPVNEETKLEAGIILKVLLSKITSLN